MLIVIVGIFLILTAIIVYLFFRKKDVIVEQTYYGTVLPPTGLRANEKTPRTTLMAIPSSYLVDVELLQPMLPQGEECNSCWAHAVSSMLVDRLSIASNGRMRRMINVDQFAKAVYGPQWNCETGSPDVAISHVINKGVSTESPEKTLGLRSRILIKGERGTYWHSSDPTEIKVEMLEEGPVVCVLEMSPGMYHSVELVGWTAEDQWLYRDSGMSSTENGWRVFSMKNLVHCVSVSVQVTSSS